MNPFVTCVITTHKDDPSRIIDTMLQQTYPFKQILVLCSDIDIIPLRKKYPGCEFFDVPNRKDWGHVKRAMGIVFAEGEYICFCNVDDEYDKQFLEILLAPLIHEKADLAYCVWKDKGIDFQVAEAKMKIRGMTSGNFILRTDIAKAIGWKYRVYAADWYFIRDVIRKKRKLIYIEQPLMTHK